MKKKSNTNTKKSNNAMSMISLRLPKETIAELKRVAPLLGFSGYQPLIRAYITQALHKDIARIEHRKSEFVYRMEQSEVGDEMKHKSVAESQAEYITNAIPSFVVKMPEFVEGPTSWGAETAMLLETLGDIEWEDNAIVDPVEWVHEQRHRQAVNRAKLP